MKRAKEILQKAKQIYPNSVEVYEKLDYDELRYLTQFCQIVVDDKYLLCNNQVKYLITWIGDE